MSLDEPHIYNIQDLLRTDIYYNPEVYHDKEIVQGILSKSPLGPQRIHLHERDPLQSPQSLTVHFSWVYQCHASPTFHNRIDAPLDAIQEHVRKVVHLQGFVIGVLIPLWIVHHMRDKAVAKLLVQLFKNRDASNFLSKGVVITKSLHFLSSNYPLMYSDLSISGMEWDAIFFVCNESLTRHEMDVYARGDIGMLAGMKEWQEACMKHVEAPECSEHAVPTTEK